MHHHQRKRILFVCRGMPWPLHGGAIIRNYWFLQALCSQYDVDLIALSSGEMVPFEISSICAAVFTCDDRFKLLSRLKETVRTRSYFLAGASGASQSRKLAERLLAERNYSAVHVSELSAASALPKKIDCPVVYDAHNCEYDLLLKRSMIEGPARRWLLQFDAVQVRKVERRMLSKAKMLLATSEQDKIMLAQLLSHAESRVHILPNGADISAFEQVRSVSGIEDHLLITGRFDWRPNVVGLLWFLDEVYPQLQQRLPDIPRLSIRVAGRMPDDVVKMITSAGLIAVPNPPDMRDELAAAKAIVVAVLASSGTRLRILEAWASCRPVITTPSGAFGLPVTHRKELMIGSSALEFADSIIQVLLSEELRKNLVKHGFEMVKHQYDWPAITQKLLSVYDTIC